MRVTRFNDAAAFYARAAPFLMAHEAEHNLLLGLATGLAGQPVPGDEAAFLATAEVNGAVVAAALMTPSNKVVVSRTAEPRAMALLAEAIRRGAPGAPGVIGPRESSRAFAEEWRRIGGVAFRPGVPQRIYQVETVTPPRGVPGALRRATRADRELLVGWLVAFAREAMGDERDPDEAARAVDGRIESDTRALYLWEDGAPVSLAGTGGPTPNGIRIGAVYTPPERRGRGYASACVAAVSRAMLDRGRRFCFLFTDLGNPTSSRIYQRIGYRPVCDVDEYLFERAGLGEAFGARRDPSPRSE